MTQLPIPVHVGCEPSEHWDGIEARQKQYGEDAAPWLQKQRRPAIAKPDLDWSALGFEPRWVGSDTADCAAALEPAAHSVQLALWAVLAGTIAAPPGACPSPPQGPRRLGVRPGAVAGTVPGPVGRGSRLPGRGLRSTS